MRLAFALSLAVTLFSPFVSNGADRKETGNAWIAAAKIIRNGAHSGSGVYLKSGLIITAAHLTDIEAKMSVHLVGVNLPAQILKQGSFENVDLSLLLFDEERVPAKIALPQMKLCEAPPWPGDSVIVVDANSAARSRIASPQVLPYPLRRKFSTLIKDVATTGNSGSGVFDPNRKCLLGIMSSKFISPKGQDIAKYFVPARVIRDFMPPELTSPK